MTAKKFKYEIDQIWIDELTPPESPIFKQFVQEQLEKQAARQEAQLLDLFLAALCAPMGRVRCEVQVAQWTGEFLGLSPYYP